MNRNDTNRLLATNNIHNNNNTPIIRSKTDNCIDSALLIRNHCSRIGDCIHEMERKMDNIDNMIT